MIEKVFLTECGYCTNDLGRIYKGHKKEIVNFPANCIIIKHSKKGWILFDTGYTESIYKNGVIGWLYNLLNPAYITEENNIKSKLKKINVKSEEISYVVLSHFHPDHICGLKFFNNATFLISKDSFKEYKTKVFRPLIFKSLLPEDMEKRIVVIENNKNMIEVYKNIYGHDLFNDGEIVLVDLKGHSKGQIGMLLKNRNLFFVADSYWRKDEIDNNIELKFAARLIQYNYAEYKKTRDWLRSLARVNSELRLISSHEIIKKVELSKDASKTADIEILP